MVDQKHEKMVFGWPKKNWLTKIIRNWFLVDQKNVKLTEQLVDQRD